MCPDVLAGCCLLAEHDLTPATWRPPLTNHNPVNELTAKLESAAHDIEGAFAGADVIDFFANAPLVSTYLHHYQLRPTLQRYGGCRRPLGDNDQSACRRVSDCGLGVKL